MPARTPPSPKEIIEWLSRLKSETPEYPQKMFAARKAAFLKQAAIVKIQGKGHGGEGGQQGSGGGAGGSSTALGGSAANLGIVIPALIGLGLVVAMLIGILTGDHVSQGQDTDRPEENLLVAGESPEPNTIETEIPTDDKIVVATSVMPNPDAQTNTISNDVNDEPDDLEILPEGTEENAGLHLGLTPGTPAAPGHGNPGNVNQPDKPEKLDKQVKPVK